MRGAALALLMLANAFLVADRELMNLLAVQIMADLDISRTQFGLLGGVSFGLFYAVFGIPLAMLADRTRRTWVLAGSLAVWSAMTVLCGRAGNFIQLAAARVGVAVGEAGGVPPSHSLLSDLYPQTHRARVFSIWMLGAPLGIVAGMTIGGHIGAELGWRAAFLAFGAPGLLLALAIAASMPEPRRGSADLAETVQKNAASLLAVIRFMLSQRSLVHTVIALALTLAVVTANSTWVATFLQYSHGFDLKTVAAALGAVLGASALVGNLAGGFLADRLARRQVDWRSRFAALAMLFATPFGFAVYLQDSRAWVLPALFVPITAVMACMGPTYALTQSLVEVRMRATASAIVLLVTTLTGATLGPFIVGALSDYLEPSFGRHSVRYALLGMSIFNLWTATHHWLASRTLRSDLQRAGG